MKLMPTNLTLSLALVSAFSMGCTSSSNAERVETTASEVNAVEPAKEETAPSSSKPTEAQQVAPTSRFGEKSCAQVKFADDETWMKRDPIAAIDETNGSLGLPAGHTKSATGVGVVEFYEAEDGSIADRVASVTDGLLVTIAKTQNGKVTKTDERYDDRLLKIVNTKDKSLVTPFKSFSELCKTNPILGRELAKAENELQDYLSKSDANLSVRSDGSGYIVEGYAPHTSVTCAVLGGGDNHDANAIAMVGCVRTTVIE